MDNGIFATNDILAIAVIKFLIKIGYKIPEDVSIAGYDDILLLQC